MDTNPPLFLKWALTYIGAIIVFYIVIVLPLSGVEEYVKGLLVKLVDVTPAVVGAVIVLIIGWIAGRALGKGLSKVLDKAGLDDALLKTVIGKAMERSGMKIVRFFDLIVRWFVYLIAILAAVNILNITVLSNFMSTLVQYLPSFIAGIFIIILGFIAADFVGDALKAVGEEAELEFSSIVADGIKIFLYFVIIVVGLSVMKIDVQILYIFANAAAWGIAFGIGAAIAIAFGLGYKDYIAKNAEKWATAITEKAKSHQRD